MRRLKNWLIDYVPAAGRFKRRVCADVAALLPPKETYSQHGEDRLIAEHLAGYDLQSAIYVDVGANHPSFISNTYLFYREGLSGLTIEPNAELTTLHRKFRPRDVCIPVACGSKANVALFELSKSPVLSRFSEANCSREMSADIQRRDYVPVLPLDTVVKAVPCEWIFLLSIDVEGFELEVLSGGIETLSRSLFVCTEANDERNASATVEFLRQHGHGLIKALGCNLIFRNSSKHFQKYRRSASDAFVETLN